MMRAFIRSIAALAIGLFGALAGSGDVLAAACSAQARWDNNVHAANTISYCDGAATQPMMGSTPAGTCTAILGSTVYGQVKQAGGHLYFCDGTNAYQMDSATIVAGDCPTAGLVNWDAGTTAPYFCNGSTKYSLKQVTVTAPLLLSPTHFYTAPSQAYSFTQYAADGAYSDTWTTTSKPAWVAINASTGALTGTASATPGDYTVAETITSSSGQITTATITITVISDPCPNPAGGTFLIAFNKCKFTYTGLATSTFTPPAYYPLVVVKARGGGGAGADYASGGSGGNGGSVKVQFPTSATTGVLGVLVAQGGQMNTSPSAYSAAGGGYTALFTGIPATSPNYCTGGTPIVIAGGGGGGAQNGSSQIGGHAGAAAGGANWQAGLDGTINSGMQGYGGTNAIGARGVNNQHASGNGGNGNNRCGGNGAASAGKYWPSGGNGGASRSAPSTGSGNGGGGGAGWFGGGAGASSTTSPSTSIAPGAGGGGSSWFDNTYTGIAQYLGSAFADSGSNNTDTDTSASGNGISSGSSATTQLPGQNGVLVVSWMSAINPAITSSASLIVPVGQLFSTTLAAYDPNGQAITWGPATPVAGVSLNAATGILSGMPNAGTYNFTVTATNAVGLVASQSYTLTITNTDPCPNPAGGSYRVGVTNKCIIYPATYQSYGMYGWTAPAGVTSATFKVWGAAGGGYYGSSPNFAGGAGGFSRGTVAVTAGQTYSIYIGQSGTGGGPTGAGGGGYTAVHGTNTFAATPGCSVAGGLSTPLFVSGAGGGSGSGSIAGSGGQNGGNSSNGGGGATQAALGSGQASNGCAGSAGHPGVGSCGGGSGQTYTQSVWPQGGPNYGSARSGYAGGGGGAGYYGGGGGASNTSACTNTPNGGGGGGSSFIVGTATATSYSDSAYGDNADLAAVTTAWGGKTPGQAYSGSSNWGAAGAVVVTW